MFEGKPIIKPWIGSNPYQGPTAVARVSFRPGPFSVGPFPLNTVSIPIKPECPKYTILI